MTVAKQYLQDPRLLLFHSPLPQQTLVVLGSRNILSSSSTVKKCFKINTKNVKICSQDSFNKKIKNIFDTDQNQGIHIDPLH